MQIWATPSQKAASEPWGTTSPDSTLPRDRFLLRWCWEWQLLETVTRWRILLTVPSQPEPEARNGGKKRITERCLKPAWETSDQPVVARTAHEVGPRCLSQHGACLSGNPKETSRVGSGEEGWVQILPPYQEQLQNTFSEDASEPKLREKWKVPNHRSSTILCFTHRTSVPQIIWEENKSTA